MRYDVVNKVAFSLSRSVDGVSELGFSPFIKKEKAEGNIFGWLLSQTGGIMWLG